MAAYELKSSLLTRVRGPEKFVTLVLLFILLTAAAAGVTSVLIGPDWASLWRGLFFGLLFGWTLAMLQLSAVLVAAITIAVGATYTLLFTGNLMERISAILAELASISSHLAASPGYPQADLTLLGQLLRELFNAVGVLFERVVIWMIALVTGEAVFDPIAAALVWSIVVWIVAAWAGWIVEARRNALLATLPAVLLSLGTLSYGQRESSTLYVMLGSTLLLLATVHYERREQGWDKSDTAYPPRKGRQVLSSALVLTVILVALSAIASSISLPRILEWVSELRDPAAAQEGGLAKSLGIMPVATASPDPFEEVRRPGLPREKLIGSGPELSKRTVMTVAVEDFPGIFKGRQAQPFYWRSFTYDLYTGHGWRTSSTDVSEHQASEPLQPELVGDYLLVHQTMRSAGGEISSLYAAGEPLSVDQTSAAAWRSPGDLFGIQISSATSYRANSLFPVVSEGILRAAGQRYPDWVRERFLALPSDIPERVKELAFQLTASESTPYDRTRAIERYLRRIPYTLDVPYPPLDQDLVDFFLFDLRQGYCDYYASAMVVLARAAGIPARIAVGYANGIYNLNAKHFLVTEADAHSWVEVYFPDIGWVPFEPTAGRPPLENSQSSDSAVLQNLGADQDKSDVVQGRTTPGAWLFILASLTMIAIAIIAWIAVDEIQLRRLSPQAAASEIYLRMRRYATRLGVTLEPGSTPYELAASLTSHLHLIHLVDASEPAHISPTIEQVHSITEGIVQVSFCPYPIFEGGTEAIYRQWRSLRWQLLLVWLKGRLQTLRDRLEVHWLALSGLNLGRHFRRRS